MKVTRFFTTDEQGSRFEDLDIALPEAVTDSFGNVYQVSRAVAGNSVLVELPAGLDQDWHCAPTRQLVCVLRGRVEVETSDGATRQWSAGGLFLADDTTGQGHRTRVLEGPAQLLFTRLMEDFNLDAWCAKSEPC